MMVVVVRKRRRRPSKVIRTRKDNKGIYCHDGKSYIAQSIYTKRSEAKRERRNEKRQTNKAKQQEEQETSQVYDCGSAWGLDIEAGS